MSDPFMPDWIRDEIIASLSRPSINETLIEEENDAEERTLVGINLEYVCPACGEQVVIYNLTKERVVSEIQTIILTNTQPTLNCQLEWIKFALVAVMDQDQVTVQETIVIKEIES